MKIMIATDHFATGGVAAVLTKLINQLDREGHEVSLLLTHTNEISKEISENIEVNKINFNRILRAMLLPQLYKIFIRVKRIQPDCIITNKDHVGFLFAILKWCRIINVPIVHNPQTTVSEVYKRSDRPLQKLRMRVSKKIFHSLDIIVNVSQAAALDAQKFYGVEKVIPIYNAVVEEKDFIQPDQQNVSHRDKTIIACGRLAFEKNYDLMLNAFSSALKKEPDMQLIILGDGNQYDHLRNLVKDLNIDGHVTFQGMVNKPLEYMYQADLFWMTSLYEGLPTVIVEALSQGSPVLAIDCPSGPAEILMDGKYGTLVNSYDIEDNAAALINALNRPRHSRDFYQTRAKDFSVDKCAKEYIRILESL